MGSTRSRDKRLLGELRQLFARAGMPTNPGLAARILKLINDPRSSANDFGDAIRADPALLTRLLRMANSAQFAQRYPVTTVGRAVTVVGISRVKTIALGFQLISHLDKLGGTPFDLRSFWQHSILRACLARSIAGSVVPERQEEAFLIGLLQDCGILLLVQVLGFPYASLCQSSLSPTAFYAVEAESFPYTHLDAISAMASEWQLPGLIATPIARHHRRGPLTPASSETERLNAISYFVGSLRLAGDLTVSPEEHDLRDFGSTVLRLGDAEWAEAQDRARAEYEQVARLYGDMLPEETDVADLLNEANRQLTAVAADADDKILSIKAERDVICQEQRRLEGALAEYRERAALDPLTNALNRGGLTEAVRKAIEQSCDWGVTVAALFLDIDNFKRFNDTHGHKAGDQILKAVAALLAQEVGPEGSVGRYGGEEFVAVLSDLGADAIRDIADRVVRRVRDIDCRPLGCPDVVTCSVGAVWAHLPPPQSAEELFAAADEQMYRAKRAGKDRFCFAALTKPTELASPSRPAAAGHQTPELMTHHTPDELAATAELLNAEEADTFTEIRKERRRKLVAPCTVHYFTGVGSQTRAEHGVTRNIGTGGVGLLMSRPMVRGEPAEVALDAGTSRIYLAGLVSFCRHVSGRIHEVGIQLVTHSSAPVLSADGVDALSRLDWIARALDAKKDGHLQSATAS